MGLLICVKFVLHDKNYDRVWLRVWLRNFGEFDKRCCETWALFALRPRFILFMLPGLQGFPGSHSFTLLLHDVFTSTRDVRIFPVLLFPRLCIGETRTLGLSFTLVNVSPGITRLSRVTLYSVVVLYYIKQNKLLPLPTNN